MDEQREAQAELDELDREAEDERAEVRSWTIPEWIESATSEP
jgi:hypothetical protein